MSYTKLNPKNGETQVNDTTMKHLDDGIYDIDQNKIDKSTIELLTVDSTAPEHCNTGDMYYNTTTNYIYTATATDTWDTTGELPSSKYLYVDLTNSKLYYYDGTTFTSYGGGSSVEVDTEMSDTSENAVQNKVIKEYVDDQIEIGDTEPTSTGNKIWIDTGEVGSQASEITNSYSTSTGIGYSANYVNNMRKVLWTNSSPTSNFNSQNVTIEDMSSYDYYEIIYKIWTGSNYQHSTGLIQKGASAVLSGIEITPSSNVGAYQSRKVDYNSSTELHFNDCYVENVYTNASTTISTSNNIMIPMQIIGHKF